MKVETPQILWNAAEGESSRKSSSSKKSIGNSISNNSSSSKGAVNAALNSVDLLPSGLPEPYNHILVTAGNSSQVNVWNLLLSPPPAAERNNNALASSTSSSPAKKPQIFQGKGAPFKTLNANSSSNNGGLQYRFSLGRQGTVTAVSCCKFSPDGLVLAVACDASNLLLYYVPLNKRGGDNGRHFWASCTKESELGQRMVSTSGEGNTDLSWSADGRRLLVASVDHSVCLVEQTGAEDWQVLYRCTEHTHYVQGVAYDPLGAYLASMSNDRSVRIYPRKANAKTIKKVLKPLKQQQKLAAQKQKQQQQQELQQQQDAESASPGSASAKPASLSPSGPLQSSSKQNSPRAVASPASASSPPLLTAEQTVRNWLSDTKFEVGKSRVIRHSRPNNNSNSANVGHWKYADESTLESFFRRLAWTADGQYLICPAGLYQSPTKAAAPQPRQTMNPKQQQHAALVFARHNFDEPHKVLTGLMKPAVAVRPNPVLFELGGGGAEHAAVEKENTQQKYRNIFCVLTWDTVLIYDTHHKEPLASLSGLHYANLTDAAWSKDGHSLFVCSSDGYVSLIRFAPGELGTPRTTTGQRQQQQQSSSQQLPQLKQCPSVQSTAAALTQACKVQDTVIPPAEPGPVQLPTARPMKKAKLEHTTTTTTGGTSTFASFPHTATTEQQLPQKREAAEPNVLIPKKKKKIQPTVVATK